MKEGAKTKKEGKGEEKRRELKGGRGKRSGSKRGR